MDEITSQVIGCLAWGTIGVMLSLFCLNLLAIMVGEARTSAAEAEAARSKADAAGDGDIGELAGAEDAGDLLAETFTTRGGVRLRFDALTALVCGALALSPVVAGASLAAASFAPEWMRATAGLLTCAIALCAGNGAMMCALSRAGLAERDA